VLAGTPVVAELPEEVAAGQRLRLAVAEVTAERVLLRVVGDPAPPPGAPPPPSGPSSAAAPTVPPPAIGLPLPGLPAAHVNRRRARRGPPGP
jgi:hypothetical protein